LSLSSDDARLSQVDGPPLLNKHGAKATFFVNPGSMQKRLEGRKKPAAAGHEIASHSAPHPCTVNYPFSAKNALEDYTLTKLESDLEKASGEIERRVGVRPVTLPYTCGQKFVGRGGDVRSYVPMVLWKFFPSRGFRDENVNDPVVCDFAQVLSVESGRLTFDR
jgi:peptidoglycan/xylan/chitin deacetylase (PgdA/CDA1 family)